MRKIQWFIWGMALLNLAGCGYSKEEKARMQAYEKQASQNAQNYIEEKYGFSGKVIQIKSDKVNPGPIPDFFPEPTGAVFVDMEYEGRDFTVYISGDEVTTDGIDNYQLTEIEEGISDVLDEITGLEPMDIRMYYGIFTNPDTNFVNGMISKLYTGDNLGDILEDEDLRVVVSYLDEDLSDTDQESLQNALTDDLRLLMVSYYTKEDYKKCTDEEYNILGTPIDSRIESNALYIREAYILEYREGVYRPFHMTEYDNIMFYPSESGEMIEVEEAEMDDESNWTGRGITGGKQVSKSYKITSETNVVHIYIPVTCLNNVASLENIRIAYQYEKDGEIHYKVAISEITGDGKYIICSIPMRNHEDVRFTAFRE